MTRDNTALTLIRVELLGGLGDADGVDEVLEELPDATVPDRVELPDVALAGRVELLD